ncbi:MAG: isoprenyl transferase [Rhodospirillales bacterium]|nr:isoprenyl transferase [Rhodospirillales bacterium]
MTLVSAAKLKISGGVQAPTHVAIIMDGNGRWAKARNLPRIAGHKRGAETVKTIVRAAADLGVSYLTLYGFSSENWNRPEDEVRGLMGLLRFYLRNEINYLHKNGVRLLIIGDRDRLDDDIVNLIEDAEAQTAKNTAITLAIALSYGGRSEITRAARILATRVAAGDISPADIDEGALEESLLTSGFPDPDLLIRTSGEKRISNFLLWQSAYSELIFVDTLWPDFSKEDLENALIEFQGRERRYGTISR